jgi:hypothetical protein
MVLNFTRLLDYVKIPLIDYLTIKSDNTHDRINAYESWILELEGLIKDKNNNSRLIRDLGRKGIPDQFRGEV